MIWFRRKERTFEQMEEQLSKGRIFDMTVQFKGLTLLLPELGFYTPLVHFNLSFSNYFFYSSECKSVLLRFNNLLLQSTLDDNKEEEDQNLFQAMINSHPIFSE